MTQLLTQKEVERIKQSQAGFRLPLGFETPPDRPRTFLLIGSGSRWTDPRFGISSLCEAVTRALQQKFVQRINVIQAELAAQGLDRQAAETGDLSQFFDEVPDSEIQRYTPREIPESEAESEILEYLKSHAGEDAFDVAIALELDPSFAASVCHRLVAEGRLTFAEDAISD